MEGVLVQLADDFQDLIGAVPVLVNACVAFFLD